MNEKEEPSRVKIIGAKVSSWVSKVSAHPFAQFGLIVACMLWFIAGLEVDVLTAALSILAITMTQMILNQQFSREADAHRRDVAMHAKLDELLIASRRARDEMAGIEEMDEDDIVRLKEHAKATVDRAEAIEEEFQNRTRGKVAKSG